jgi:predicted kinase
VFTTECSGKTTFCRSNGYKLAEFDLIDWDKIMSVPSANIENEVTIINLLLELKSIDQKIYFTNILPPEFIFNAKDYYNNVKFAIIKIPQSELKENIKKRHHPLYDSNYIIEKHKELSLISDNSKLLTFTSFKEFHQYFLPIQIGGIGSSIKRIIRL